MVNVTVVAQTPDKWFGEDEAHTCVPMQISFEAGSNKVLFVVGPSGSGKTALLSVISGTLRPDGGRAMVDGINIWNLGADALADFRLGRIGFTLQDYHLSPCLTTVENVIILLILRHAAWGTAFDRAMHYLDVAGLRNRTQLSSVKFSGGEQQCAATVRAVVMQSDTPILDEPIASLDGGIGHSIMQFVKTEILSTHRCIVIVTHNTHILDLASHIPDMEDGKLSRIEHGAMR